VILVDTSIWVDHLREGDSGLARLLEDRRVLVHPYVIGELALGHLRDRRQVLLSLGRLPQIEVARHDEVLALIEAARLAGTGIGYVDAHLLASIRLRPGSTLWTGDKRLAAVSAGLELGSTH